MIELFQKSQAKSHAALLERKRKNWNFFQVIIVFDLHNLDFYIGSNITVPIPRPPRQLSNALLEQIARGEYILGDKIAPKKFIITSISDNGE